MNQKTQVLFHCLPLSCPCCLTLLRLLSLQQLLTVVPRALVEVDTHKDLKMVTWVVGEKFPSGI